MKEQNASEVFNKLLWHDSKLRTFQLFRRDDGDELILEVELIHGPDRKLTPMTVVFEEIAFFICDIDVDAKRQCTDDISNAWCSPESELKTKKKQQQLSPDELQSHFHFHLSLCPPGGSLDIIAPRFRLGPPSLR
jgi:hypothetical protein